MSLRTVSVGVCATAVALTLLSCSDSKRPDGVPSSAVRVESAKTFYWKACEALAGGKVHCTIWNGGGTVLMNENFVPQDGGPTPTDLHVLERPCASPYSVCLADGPILVPESMFDRMRMLRKTE